MNTKQIEALKLALSVLDEVRSETFRLLRNGQKLYAEEKVWNAIFVIKQALAEQPAQQQEPWVCECKADSIQTCKCVFKAQPNEPVAYIDMREWPPIRWRDGLVRADVATFDGQGLFFAPPASKPWMGLTDEEKAKLDAEHGDDTLAHLDAIEAKLREKNA